jgi:phosphoribosylaminoimidazole-succinocarboxamide synthase
VYDLGDRLLLVCTDRLSAFDRHVCSIPCKGSSSPRSKFIFLSFLFTLPLCFLRPSLSLSFSLSLSRTLGRVLNLVSQFWFERTGHIIPNHVLSVPHPNVTVAVKCTPFPIEFVVRGYITGTSGTSLWTHYSKGVREYCGHVFPDGLQRDQKLPSNVMTPTTKSDVHDELISAAQIIASGRREKREI